MHTDQYDPVPDLALLAGDYWTTDPVVLSLEYSSHEIESLKLYVHIIWPARSMHENRRTFLAHCALRLREKNRQTAADVQHGRDGIEREPSFANQVAEIYNHAADVGVTHLFDPSGGLASALERSRPEIAADIDRQLVRIRTAVCLADFILRYLVHVPNGKRTASVNKAAYFIEEGRYENLGTRVLRNRSEIIQAWSQSKPTIVYGLAAFYLETIFLSNILKGPDPAHALDQVWQHDLRREQFFSIARYCESELRGFVPNRSKEPLLDSTTMSVPTLEEILECWPILQKFSDEDLKKIASYRAKLYM
jgi:hypothetical protein